MRATIAQQLDFQHAKLRAIALGEIKAPRPVDPIPKNFHERVRSRYPDMQMWQCSVCHSEFACEHREPELLRHFIALPIEAQLDLINQIDVDWRAL